MEVYYLLFYGLFSCFLLTLLNSVNKRSYIFLFLGIIFLLYFAANKSFLVGTDSYNYYVAFLNPYRYKDEGYFESTQIVWFYINVFLTENVNYPTFLYFCYSIILFGFGYLIIKKSKNYMFSLLLIYLLYFYLSSFNIMRQYIALAFIAVGFVYLADGRKIIYMLLVGLACCFHFSAFFMLCLIFVDRFSISNKAFVFILLIISFMLGVIFNELLIPYVQIFGDVVLSNVGGHTSAYSDAFGGERNFITNFLFNVVFIATYVLYSSKNDFFLKLYFLFIFLNNLLGASSAGNRIFLYFQISMFIIIPNTFQCEKKSVYKWSYLLLVIIYAIGIWNHSLSNNFGEIVPYKYLN